VFGGLEQFFIIFFSVELLLRILAERTYFCSRKNGLIRWNIFDSVIVVTALVEEFANLLFGGTYSNVGGFRAIRMLRLMRIFRVIRVFRFFKELRVMVSGILGSLRSLMWALILLGCIKYIFAMVILQFAAMEFERDIDTKNADLMLYYGSIVECMNTLYQAICGGLDWGDAARPLRELSIFLSILLALYIAFAVFCVLNIVTGVFVESAKQMTAEDQDMVLMEQLETRERWFDEVKSIFEATDIDGSGFVNGEEFTTKIKEDARLQAQFRKIGVQVEAYSAAGLFQLLDLDGDGELDLDEFCLALQMVHGTARSIDVAKLTHDTRIIRRGIMDMEDMLAEYFMELTTLVTQQNETKRQASEPSGDLVVPIEQRLHASAERLGQM
jgi:Ca2+-binding EF-hand superfamily protein